MRREGGLQAMRFVVESGILQRMQIEADENRDADKEWTTGCLSCVNTA